MNELDFLKAVINQRSIRCEHSYLYQIEANGIWYTFATDGSAIHVVKEKMYPDSGDAIELENISYGNIQFAEEYIQKRRALIPRYLPPEYENPIELYFDTDHLRRILDYAGEARQLALIIQRRENTGRLFDFSDGTVCFAYILVDSALFSLGNVHGTVEQNTTVYLQPRYLRQALDGITYLPDVKLVFDAAHLDAPVTFGDENERFAVIMPMCAPSYSIGFMVDFIGGFGKQYEVTGDHNGMGNYRRGQ
jgi:hypothetical protein